MNTLHKKTNTILLILIIFFLIILFFLPQIIFAQETFVPLTEGGIPGIESGIDFNTFLNIAFKIGLAAAVTLAVVMLTIGGFEYMTRESVSEKTAGKERIQNAIVGLLIALLIWLILFTINPTILNFDINIKKTNIKQSEFQGINSKNNPNDKQGGESLKNP